MIVCFIVYVYYLIDELPMPPYAAERWRFIYDIERLMSA